MASQTIQSTSRTGLDLGSLAVAADVAGDSWATNGNEILYIKNGGGAPVTLTLRYGVGAVFDGSAVSDRTISVGAGKELLVGPFPVALYADANGKMNLSYSGVSSVTVCVFRTGS